MKDPKAIRKAIMTARNIAAMVDPNFARVPLPQIGEPDTEETQPPLNFMGGGYASGGEVYGDNSKIPIVGSHEGEHRLVPISPKNTNYRHVMEYVPIDWLMERRGNEYRHSPERMEQLRNEIQEEGLREPVLISTGKNSRTSIVGEGNHRVLAAKQLGYTHIPVRAMVGSSAGNDVFPEGAHDEDIIPEPNRYFPSDAKPSRVMRSLGYEGQPELPEDWWEKGYAAGGEVDEQPIDYSAPDKMGLYSHGAATAASFPQAKASPEEFRSMLTNRGVKPAEFQESGYDEAFAGQPQVTREQVAEHFHQNRTPIEEKGFYSQNANTESIAALEDEYWKKYREYTERKQAHIRENPDVEFDPNREESDALRRELNENRRALRESELYIESAGDPHHEEHMLPGGENYREIALKHGGDDVKFEGVDIHLGGEPNVLTHLLMKDRTDSEGKRLLHLDELQSDWGQKGRKEGFSGPIDEDRYQKLAWNLDNSPEDEAEFEEMKKKIKGVSPAPYVTKTDDWVDLGLKRAMMEAAKGGHDKLAWSPGDINADRYNLSKHIDNIHHEKNDDGTYNVMAYNHKGAKVYDQDDLAEKDVVDVLGKDVAGKIFSGEGIDREGAQAKVKEAHNAYEDFKGKLVETDMQRRMADRLEREPDFNWTEEKKQELQNILSDDLGDTVGGSNHFYAKKLGLEEEHNALYDNVQKAFSDMNKAPYSPYRDWRTLSGVDLTVGGEGMKKFYDEILPKRLMKLAKQHDPDAKFSVSTVKHPKEYSDNGRSDYISDTTTDLPALDITPRMRESILKKGFVARAAGGEVEGYAEGGDVDPERVREYLKRIQSPLSSNPESVQRALQIAQSYRGKTGMETGTGSFYGIKQSMPASAVTSTIGDIPGVKLKPKKQGSWEDFYNLAKDNEFVNVGGDLSGFGRLTHINGKELAWPVDLHAGADYMREPNPGRVWANIQAHATGYKNKIADANKRGKDLYGILSPMGPTAVSSSHNMFDTLMAQIPNAGIDSEHVKEFDAAIKRGDHLADMKTKKPKLFAEYTDKLKKWPGLENAKEASEFARPETGNINGTHRTKIVEFMDKAYWRDRGFPEVGVTRAAISNPDLMGTGGNKLGYRAVKLTADEPAGGKKIFEHSTYPVDTFGEYVMDLPLVQRHYAQPDVIDRLVGNPTKSGQIVHPYSEDAMGRSTARKMFEEQKQVQPVNQRMLDSVMTGMENQEKYGFKKGGKVRSALMIAKGLKKR